MRPLLYSDAYVPITRLAQPRNFCVLLGGRVAWCERSFIRAFAGRYKVAITLARVLGERRMSLPVSHITVRLFFNMQRNYIVTPLLLTIIIIRLPKRYHPRHRKVSLSK